jgi:hypothetical protein
MTCTCPYCSQPAKLVTGKVIYPHRPDLHDRKFWHCAPCQAYVGCHRAGKGEAPLGRLANAELRMWKMRAHEAFDPLWKELVDKEIEVRGGQAPKGIKQRHRTDAYKNLAQDLGIALEDCHIGMFDVETCQRVVSICNSWTGGIPA